jgi:hypothetical protein
MILSELGKLKRPSPAGDSLSRAVVGRGLSPGRPSGPDAGLLGTAEVEQTAEEVTLRW